MNLDSATKGDALTVAEEFGIDPALICAICDHESSWNTNAYRYEPAFYDKYIKRMVGNDGLIKGFTDVDEARLRATSLGLMQVMGQVAREQGFMMNLSGLFVPTHGLVQGCTKLAKCLKLKGTVEEALLMYNGGGDPRYPSMVLSKLHLYQ